MKTKKNTEKSFDAVQMMRDIRDKIDKETEGMSFEELKNYFNQCRSKNRKHANSQGETAKGK